MADTDEGRRSRRPLIATLVMAAVSVLAVVAGAVGETRVRPLPDPWYVLVMDVLGLFSVVLGLYVAVRRPANIVGALLAGFGMSTCLITMSGVYDDLHAAAPARFPVSGTYVALGQGAWMLWFLLPALILSFFPTGRLSGSGQRFMVAGLMVDVAVHAITAPFVTAQFDPPYADLRNPLLLSGPWATVLRVPFYVSLLGLLFFAVAVLASLIRRFRRSSGPLRAQLKWLLLGAAAIPVGLLLCWTSFLVLHTPDLVVLALLVVLVSIPLATTIGLLRHQLYDVDRAIAATVTYAVLSAGLLTVFTVASFLGGLTLGHRSSVVAAAATAVCAAVLAPLRRRLRTAIDRRLHPGRRRALDAVEALRARIHAGSGTPEQLTGVLRAALADPLLQVGFRVPGSDVDVDADGVPVTGMGVPVVLAGTPVGVLVAPGRPRPLLREVADAAASLFEIVRLRAGLADALRDVESSRNRLLQAGYEERRRLERDLHDGAQQRLVALGMSLRLAQRHLTDGSVDTHRLLDESVAELAGAVTELRQIAHGIRPSSLDDGLGPALTTLVGRLQVPVAMTVEPGELPDEIATTAFFVATEAVVNAVKHADAQQISVQVRHRDERLVVSIADDGAGGAVVRPGAGLAGLGDRVAAAGGALRVVDRPGGGTLVEAVLPCAS